MTLSERVMVFWNFGIVFGYFLMAGVMMVARVRFPNFITWDATACGALFFMTCGGTHLEQAFHLMFQDQESIKSVMTSTHMQIIHGLQCFAIIAFAFTARSLLIKAFRTLSF